MRSVKRLVTAAFALLTAACGSDMACTAVGCASVAAVRVHDLSPALHYPVSAHACFDQRCADVTIALQPPVGSSTGVPCSGGGRVECVDARDSQGYVDIGFDEPSAGSRVHTASVEVRDADGAVVLRSSQPLRLRKTAPNGEQCGPICWFGTADFR